MIVPFEYRALPEWPRAKRGRGYGWRPKCAERVALEFRRKMRWLEATDIAIHLECDPNDIPTPRMPPDGDDLRGQGVVLTFTARGRNYSFCCDHFGAWEGNLWSILETLDALLPIGQFHCVSDMEQYAGWCTGPAPSSRPAA
jgi:hypothetical protein